MNAPLILIAEDSPDILMVLLEVLEMEGYRVHTASDGQAAWDYLTNCNRCPDLLITDIMMPRMGGLDLIDKVKKAENLAKMSIAIYSASGHYKPIADKLGVKFLNKPFDLDILMDTVRSLTADKEAV